MVHDRHVVIGALFAAASLYFTLPSAAAFACDLPPGQKATVAEVRDGETLALADGTIVRLINAKAPVARPCRARRPSLAIRRRSQAGFERACLRRRDRAPLRRRQGRSPWPRAGSGLCGQGRRAHCGCKASSSAKGLARVYSFPDNHACVDDLLAREAEARAKGAGLWGTWAYRVLDAGNVERLGRLTRSYQLVEGVVAAGRRVQAAASISTSTRIGARISPSSWSARTARPSRLLASIPRRLPERSSGCGAGSSGVTAP